MAAVQLVVTNTSLCSATVFAELAEQALLSFVMLSPAALSVSTQITAIPFEVVTGKSVALTRQVIGLVG